MISNDTMKPLDGRALLMAFALCAAACGGDSGGEPAPVDSAGGLDGDAGTCGTTGMGTVNGTVGGQTVSPVMTAFLTAVPDAGVALVIGEQQTACEVDTSEPGQRLVLFFCDAVTAGQYTVLSEQDFNWGTACPGQRIAGSIVEDATGSDLEDGVTGAVTVDSADGCITGSFSVTYTDDNTMSGSFSAMRCAP